MGKLCLGIDIGCSAVKAAVVDANGTVLTTARLQKAEWDALQEKALTPFLSNGLAGRICRIALTGVGAAKAAPTDAFPGPVQKVDEFSAVCAGALALSGEREGMVVSMGTGTAFLWADADGKVRHLCGSGIGGGTLSGLVHCLTGTANFSELQMLADVGDLRRVDLTIRDLMTEFPPTLRPDMTAANFGRPAPEASSADLAAGAVNLVLQAVGTMAVLACQCCGSKTAILTGALTELHQAAPNFALFQELYGIHFLIPEAAAYAAAIGAARISSESADL